MSDLRVIVFPFVPLQREDKGLLNKYRYHAKGELFSEEPKLDWSSTDPYILTRNLVAQSGYERYKLGEYAVACHRQSPLTDIIIQKYSISRDDFTKACKELVIRSKDYKQIISYDEQAVAGGYEDNQSQFIPLGSQVYVVVLIYQGEYYGHVYSFLSPSQPEYGIILGMRSRLDIRFLGNKTLYNISSYLLEGARRILIHLSCQYIVMPDPLEKMAEILTKFGFTMTEDTNIGKFDRTIAATHSNIFYHKMCECYYAPSTFLTHSWSPDLEVTLF